jgi:hypothetical protein
LGRDNLTLAAEIEKLSKDLAASHAYTEEVLESANSKRQKEWQEREGEYKDIISQFKKKIAHDGSKVPIALYNAAVNSARSKTAEAHGCRTELANMEHKVAELQKQLGSKSPSGPPPLVPRTHTYRAPPPIPIRRPPPPPPPVAKKRVTIVLPYEPKPFLPGGLAEPATPKDGCVDSNFASDLLASNSKRRAEIRAAMMRKAGHRKGLQRSSGPEPSSQELASQSHKNGLVVEIPQIVHESMSIVTPKENIITPYGLVVGNSSSCAGSNRSQLRRFVVQKAGGRKALEEQLKRSRSPRTPLGIRN